MKLTETISLIELIWTSVCVFGFVFCIRRFYRAVALLSFIRLHNINEYREYAVVTKVISYAAYTFVQLGFIIVGVIAMLIPIQSGSGRVSPLTFASGGIFILISFVLAVSAYILDTRDVQLERKIIAAVAQKGIRE